MSLARAVDRLHRLCRLRGPNDFGCCCGGCTDDTLQCGWAGKLSRHVTVVTSAAAAELQQQTRGAGGQHCDDSHVQI